MTVCHHGPDWLRDGSVVTDEYCEKPEIKGDALEYADCQTMFVLWPKCEALTDPMDKAECQQKVLDKEDPFAGADAGP